MFNSPQLEFDIRSRQAWLAQQLAAESNLPLDFPQLLADCASEFAGEPPAADQLSFFALERLGAKVKLPVAKFEMPGQAVRQGSLVWVAPNIQANLEDARELAKASLIVSSPDWRELITQARQQARPRRTGP